MCHISVNMSLLTQKCFCTDTVNTEISRAINSKMSPHTDTEKQRFQFKQALLCIIDIKSLTKAFG